MMKVADVFKRVLKTFIWIVSILVLIFLITAGIIQIPFIQTKIVRYATTLVSNKTHTKVEIRNVSISFPKSIVVEGLFLEDLQKDTLLYAGKTEVNIALLGLLSSKIDISSIALEDATVRLHSTKTDPLFNYNFLVTAFSDTTKPVVSDSLVQSKWTFDIDHISLKNIRFRYNDEFAGMDVSAALKESKFSLNGIDLQKSVYRIDELSLEGLIAKVFVNASQNIQTNPSASASPKISAKNLQLSNSTIIYTDLVGYLSVNAIIDRSELKDANLDLQMQLLSSNSLELSKSQIFYHTFAPEVSINTTASSSGSDWKVTMNSIEMADNTFVYQIGNNPELKGAFDPDNLTYSKLNLEATDFQYSTETTKASVKKFSTTDQNNFEITNLGGEFKMDEHSITTNELKASTPHSTLDADFNIQFKSLATLTDSLQFTDLNLDLKSASITNSDILYFKPDLKIQPFFQNSSTITTASGLLSGQMNNLFAKNLVLKTGANTTLETDFSIKGLPEYKTAFYDFPNLKLTSGKKDIEMLADTLIPESMEIPENISLQLAFKGQLKSFKTNAEITSSFGNANLTASVDPDENFSGKLNLINIELGRMLKDTLKYGPISLTADASGQGMDLKTMKAKIKAEITSVYLNKYDYQNVKMEGSVSGQVFEGKLSLKDKNAEFDLDATANLNPGQEQVQLRLNLAGADLQKLNFSKPDLRAGLVATADFKGNSVDNINGKVKIANIVLAHDMQKYALDSVVITSVNVPGKSEFSVKSDIVDIKYAGGISPYSLPAELEKFINQYFPISDTLSSNTQHKLQDFNFEIQLHNHPILSEIIFPELHEFQPGIIQGSFDSQTNNLKMNAIINKMVYGSTEIKDFAFNVNSDLKALNYQISCRSISNSLASLNNFLIDGNLADGKINTTISSLDEKKNKKLAVTTQIIRKKDNYKLTLNPADFYMMYEKWNIAADNSIEFGNQGFLIHHFSLNDDESQINMASVNDKFNDDVNLEIKNLALDDVSGIFQKDTSLVKGVVDGNILLKRVNNSYGLIADAQIMNLIIGHIPIGNLTVKAENPTTEKFDIDLKLSSAENNLTANGFYVPNGGDQSIHINAAIQSLSLQTVQAFSMGTITKASGNLTGNFLVEGNTSLPEITGQLSFNNAYITPAFLNNPLELKHETFQLKNDGIYFNQFTILDQEKHTAILDGAVNMNRFSDFKFALSINTKDFLLFNTTQKDNKEFYGRMIIDSKIGVSGPMSLPVVNAKIKLKKGSNFTFAVPEDQLTTDKGEDVVEFETGNNLNPILYPAEKKEVQKSSLTGFDVSSILEIDKEATLHLLMDPSSTDSLVVRGDAALSFTIDRSGKMSLTGAYNLNDGSYMASLESLIKRKFDIDRGSTIIWNGDTYDAEISINARYEVRASPIDLMSDQMTGLSETDKNGYKQRYPFLVLLKLRGKILQPEISFEIQLPPDEKGILNGAVNQKLSMLNEDESSLNKQVFALLVLGRFIQENPLQTETGGTSDLVRATVGKILSQQLNQWSSKVLPGVDLNFDIQSYNDYQTGAAQGRTQVDIGLKKQLFDERLSVQLGGSVDVEGEKARQNSASNITSDVDVEYKLTKDGRYRLKGFRHNQYEGVIEGQLVETGAGVIYVRDFNKWKEFLRKKKKKTESDTLKMKKNK